MAGLFEVPHGARDDAWTAALLDNVGDASFAAWAPQIRVGPDGLGYFGLALPAPGPFTPFSIRTLLPHLLESGVGVTVGADNLRPEWVFRHGDVVSFAVTDAFLQAVPVGEVGPLEGVEILVASPSTSILPTPTRAVLRRMLQGHGVPDPRVGLLCVPREGGVQQILAVDLPAESTVGADQVLSLAKWLLPRHYRVVGIPPSLRNSMAVL